MSCMSFTFAALRGPGCDLKSFRGPLPSPLPRLPGAVPAALSSCTMRSIVAQYVLVSLAFSAVVAKDWSIVPPIPHQSQQQPLYTTSKTGLTYNLHHVCEVQALGIHHAQQLLSERGVEDAAVVRVDGERVAQSQPLRQVGMLVVPPVAQGDQVGRGAHLDGWRFVLGQQLQHLQSISQSVSQKNQYCSYSVIL